MKHTQHFIQLQAKFRSQRNWILSFFVAKICVLCLMCGGLFGCTRSSQQNMLWYDSPHRSTFALRTIAGEVLDSTMTIELQRALLLTTTTINGTRSTRSELIRVLPDGLYKVLLCDKSTTTQSTSEALFYSRLALDTSTVLRACPGDTVNVFHSTSKILSLPSPLGTLTTRTIREIDKTGIVVDYFINERFGIVRIDFFRARFDTTLQQHVIDSTLQLYEQALLSAYEQVKQRPAL
jgi:hypothetical protein